MLKCSFCICVGTALAGKERTARTAQGACPTMRLKLSKWASITYEKNSVPCVRTLRAMAMRGDIPGAFQDKAKRWYVETGDTRVSQIDAAITHTLKGDTELQGLFN